MGSLRRRTGDQVARLADWLRYPPYITCQKPGCGYVDGGVHESPDDCPKCANEPERRGEHHAFVAPPWWRRIGAQR